LDPILKIEKGELTHETWLKGGNEKVRPKADPRMAGNSKKVEGKQLERSINKGGWV